MHFELQKHTLEKSNSYSAGVNAAAIDFVQKIYRDGMYLSIFEKGFLLSGTQVYGWSEDANGCVLAILDPLQLFLQLIKRTMTYILIRRNIQLSIKHVIKIEICKGILKDLQN